MQKSHPIFEEDSTLNKDNDEEIATGTRKGYIDGRWMDEHIVERRHRSTKYGDQWWLAIVSKGRGCIERYSLLLIAKNLCFFHLRRQEYYLWVVVVISWWKAMHSFKVIIKPFVHRLGTLGVGETWSIKNMREGAFENVPKYMIEEVRFQKRKGETEEVKK